jgi:hypothetical protein
MSLIDKLERKFGRFAIPGLVNIIAGLQVAVWILLKIQPSLVASLVLFPPAVRAGELWRLVTWLLVPSSSNVIWLLFAVMLMFMMGDALDTAWGAFRTNLYVVGGAIFVAAGVMLWGENDVLVSGMYLYATLFFAFAMFHPDYEILLFLIIPMKSKYLALLWAGETLLEFIRTEQTRVPIFLSVLNFVIAFGGHFLTKFRRGAQVSVRRRKFQTAQEPDTPSLHRCHSCGKTEADDPHLDFRVAADGNDYCSECRKAGKMPSG